MKVSVVIPNYNGTETLPLVWQGLSNQTRPADEIIFVDDGSTDNSSDILKGFDRAKVLTQKNSGAPIARNRGIREATGEIVIFIDNDIIPTSNFIAEHLKTHDKYLDEKTAVVGLTVWDPALKLTPFQKWLGEGMQFDYHRLSGKERADFLAFYTSNLSLHRKFLLENPFDEEFRLPGATAFEDTELGFRLEQAGMNLYFNPEALAYHHEEKTLSQVAERKFKEGQISHLLYEKHPEIARFNKEGIKKLTRPLFYSPLGDFAAWLARIFEQRVKIGPVFYVALMKRYIEGQDATR